MNELEYDDVVILENPDYDSAIIGVSEDRRVIYDFDKMVEHLMDHNAGAIVRIL